MSRQESGLLSLEACISLFLFIFAMLFMYSFFVVFEAQNEIAHALLSTADSMALDVYSNQKLRDPSNISSSFVELFDAVESLSGHTTSFVSRDLWNRMFENQVDSLWDGSIYASESYGDEVGKKLSTGEKRYAVSDALTPAIKQRFVAYLTGGDERKADEMLKKRYHIKDGLDGLDFSRSSISSGTLHLQVRYYIKYQFSLPGFNELSSEQKCASKLWKP